MIDHLLGRPSSKLKRLQVLLVLAFWGAVLRVGPRDGPSRFPLIVRLNQRARRFSPWQIFVFSLTSVYAIRHLDAVAGFGAPEPLARMYSRSFYRATWINTALDAGFASAMSVRPQWLRDLASILFSLYYIIYANEADEKLRRYRAFCTIDFLRTTWNKTSNPYIRARTVLERPRMPIAEQILIPRPSIGPHTQRPIRCMLFYCQSLRHLREEDELVIDFVGGGFVAMNPTHHEERLRQVAKELRRPVLAVDYCKAPEYPYPYALEECFDLYRSLHESKGSVLGMSGRSTFRTILTGDSAGGNLACGVMFKILEYPQPHIKSAFAAKAAGGPGSAPPTLPRPIAMVLNYPATNFAYSSWMKPDHLNVLRSQSEANLQSVQPMHGGKANGMRLTKRDSIDSNIGARRLAHKAAQTEAQARKLTMKHDKSYTSLTEHAEMHLAERALMAEAEPASPLTQSDGGAGGGAWMGRIESDEVERMARSIEDSVDEETQRRAEQQRALQEAADRMDLELNEKRAQNNAMPNTRLTLTSMAGYFQDRILTQSMMRAMAIMYIGPRRQPDFDSDYLLSPVVAPAKYLADFPPVLFTCGEKDPMCDDTVVMAGRIRHAKLARQMVLKRRGARFGEQLRMSGHSTVEEEEDVDDWVQMRIIEGWSHGYLQMSALLPEVKRVISYLAQWMGDAFDDYAERSLTLAQRQSEEARRPGDKRTSHPSPAPSPSASLTSPPTAAPTNKRDSNAALSPSVDVRSPPPAVKPKLGPLQPPPSSSDEDDDEEDGPLTFTPRSRRSPSLQSQDSHTSISGLGAAAVAAAGPASRGVTSPIASPHLSPARLRLVNKVQGPDGGNAGGKPRPNSFSMGERTPSAIGLQPTPASSLALPPPSMPVRRRRSNDMPVSTLSNPGGEGALVKESSILQRRRMDALGYMGGATEDLTGRARSNSAVQDSGSDSE